jgi:hypothetical protein
VSCLCRTTLDRVSRFVPHHTTVTWITGEPPSARLDFLVQSQGKTITLFEDQVAMLDENSVQATSEQARTCAAQPVLLLFVASVAKGYRIYRLSGAEKNRGNTCP